MEYLPGNAYPELRRNRSNIPSGFLLSPNDILVLNTDNVRKQFQNFQRRGRLYNRLEKKQKKKPARKIPTNEIVGTKLLNDISENSRQQELIHQLRTNNSLRKFIKQKIRKRPVQTTQAGGARKKIYVLQKVASGNEEQPETKIYFARDNNCLFETPFPFIGNDNDLENILQRIREIDPIEFYTNFRPSSKWIFKRLLDYS
ncbi:hypothetical protein HK096_010835, partial [Nowakowskiella sp. JEL0078]